jgi:flagellar protein FlaI
MASVTMPVSTENKVNNQDKKLFNGDLYQKLPPPLKEAVEKAPHLLEYLNMVPVSEVGIPQYYPKLSRKLSEEKEPNLIYPVGSKGIFVHILFDHQDNRNNYITVEPVVAMDLDSLVHEVEDRCIELSDSLDEFSDENREKQLLDYIEQVVTVTDRPAPRKTQPDPEADQPDPEADQPASNSLKKRIGFLRKNGDKKPATVEVTPRELEGIKYVFVRDKIGLGVLEPLVTDPYIEDVSCSGLGHVFVEHKIFKSLKSKITFFSLDELDMFVLRLSERVRKPVSYKSPVADATLPDGSRINIVYGRDVSKRGSNFSIRKFSEVPISIFDEVEFGTINYQMLAYMSLVINNGMNVFVSGESASGKTAMLNAVTTFIHPLAKVITIEDTPELQVPHKNWIREVVQTTKAGITGGGVGMFDLLRAALRQRPNEILVGEIRGPEGNIAFQAMQTGHSVMATFHAASVEKLIQRITSNPILVPKTYIDNLHVIVLMSIAQLANGKLGRRVTGIDEIVGYDPIEESFNIVESFHWDESEDKFYFTGYMTSYILEHKIAPMMGIPTRKKRQIYTEVERRAKILEKLHKEQGVTGFYEVLEVLGEAQKKGLF